MIEYVLKAQGHTICIFIGTSEVGQKACVAHSVKAVRAAEVVFGDHKAGVAQGFRDEREIHSLTQEDGGKAMSCRIGRERRDSQFLGDFLKGVVAHTDDLPDRVGDGKHIGRSFGIFKKVGFRIAVIGVAPTMKNIKHFRGDHRADDLRAAIDTGCLAAKETDLAVYDILIFKEEHIPEVDAVAEVGEEP